MGNVVGSTDSGNRYNYSVVYVYPDQTPWVNMWGLLEGAEIKDKWRGKNSSKQSYFIYVGAYYATKPAQRRQHNLLALTGESPQIHVRDGFQALAAN